MRTYFVWGFLGVIGAGVLGCSAGGAGSKTTGGGKEPGAGGNSSTNGGKGSGLGGLSGPGLGDVGGMTGADVMDPDPSNPNITHPKCNPGTCADFPAEAILGAGVPANVAELFGEPASFTPGGLCVIEPQLSGAGKEGAMMPANWVRPRFRVAAPTGIDLLEIRVHSPVEKNDLVAYTTYAAGGPAWYMPQEIWAGLGGDMVSESGNGFANNAAGQPVTVTIRGINSKSPSTPVGMTGDFNIAPVVATGSMVFWTVNSAEVTASSSKLLGFAVGDEGVGDALTLPQIQWTGELGEDGGVLRGHYDTVKLADFDEGEVRCVGCHTTMPDGSGVIFTDDWPWSKAAAGLGATAGAIPTYITPGAQAIMKMPWWGTQTISPAHFAAGDRILVTTYGSTFKSGTKRVNAWEKLPVYDNANPANNDRVKLHELAWINLESTATIDVAVPLAGDYGEKLTARQAAAAAAKGTGWGIIATGDTGVGAASPSFNHKGDSIVYVATDYSPDGHPDAEATVADLKVVPYNNKAGGASTPLMGASDKAFLEYYPAYSADDALIAFTRAPTPSAASPDGPYYNRFGQINVIPAAGGTPTPLAANDPVSCGGDDVAGGIINSWPKWSPDAFVANGKTYYFLIFSSARKYGDEFTQQFKLPPNPLSSFKGKNDSSQLYLAAIVVDNETKAVTTYPAVYIWNQNRAPGAGGTAASLKYSNLTPAWDPIKLPDLMIPPVKNDVPK